MTLAIHWRGMTAFDLPMVETIAAAVHPGFPEDTTIFAERQQLYPAGTRFLEYGGAAAGYVVSHPWRLGTLPALNSLLGALPSDADTFYLHDLALLPPARGTGAAAAVVGDTLRHARASGFATVSLVAVNGSQPFWHKHGFRPMAVPELAVKLASYEPSARLMVRTF